MRGLPQASGWVTVQAVAQPRQQHEPRLSRAAFYAVAVGVAVLDQISKAVAVQRLVTGVSVPLLGPVASLTLTHNRGSAMGLLPGSTQFLAGVGLVAVLVLVIWGPRYGRTGSASWWGISLLLGGAAGNLVDRLRLGYVVDFIDLHWWPVFNIADIAVVCGAALAALALARNRLGPTLPDKD